MVILLAISCSDIDDVVNTSTQDPVDVYVAGLKNSHACYWKNNQFISLSDNNSSFSTADSILVKNNDVHVVGTAEISGVYEKFYWKNGVLTNLTQTFSTPDQIVRQITGWDIDGNDVYFVGYTKNPLIAAEIYDLVYWKNGIKTIVKQNTNNLVDSKIKIFDNTIYISGKENDVNGYYVNNIFNATPNVNLKDFAINNNEIYTFGSYLLSNKILNLSTGSEIIIGFSNDANLINLCFENNHMFYSNGYEIYKNSLVIYDVQEEIPGNFIPDFKVQNNNVYTLENHGDFVLNQIVTVNNTTIMTALADEFFNSLFIYQN